MPRLKVRIFLLAVTLLVAPVSFAWAQEEVTSSLYRYREREMSRGSYEIYEMKPRSMQFSLTGPVFQRGVISFNSLTSSVRRRQHLPDSHMGLKFYQRRCVECHSPQGRDIHTVRLGITCRQCHGGEPIASINHYYSLMNPIRRHSYVCAKCHQGATASFATYRIHEPPPFSNEAREKFPALYYVFWVMIILAVGTFVVFLPHSFLWGLRELFMRKEKQGGTGPEK